MRRGSLHAMKKVMRFLNAVKQQLDAVIFLAKIVHPL
jgi:hypothetical protein